MGTNLNQLAQQAPKSTNGRPIGAPIRAYSFQIRATSCYLKIYIQKSSPSAYAITPSNSTIPTIWAYSINLSPGLRPVIISYKVNNTCPPSKAGIGNIFIKASTILNSAVIDQKRSQSQQAPNMAPILKNQPSDTQACPLE